jgi:hypothetical protein
MEGAWLRRRARGPSGTREGGATLASEPAKAFHKGTSAAASRTPSPHRPLHRAHPAHTQARAHPARQLALRLPLALSVLPGAPGDTWGGAVPALEGQAWRGAAASQRAAPPWGLPTCTFAALTSFYLFSSFLFFFFFYSYKSQCLGHFKTFSMARVRGAFQFY